MEKNKNIDSYKIVSDSSSNKFEKEVNKLLEDGWQPYGEMKFSPENENYSKTFYQPMVKYSKV